MKDIVDQKVEVRAHPEKRLHAKIYIFRPKVFNEHTPASVITGSSNLTEAGLGTSEKSIVEKIESILEIARENNFDKELVNPKIEEHTFEIDILVYKLYQLTYDEVLLVDPEFSMDREDYVNFEIEKMSEL